MRTGKINGPFLIPTPDEATTIESRHFLRSDHPQHKFLRTITFGIVISLQHPIQTQIVITVVPYPVNIMFYVLESELLRLTDLSMLQFTLKLIGRKVKIRPRVDYSIGIPLLVLHCPQERQQTRVIFCQLATHDPHMV